MRPGGPGAERSSRLRYGVGIYGPMGLYCVGLGAVAPVVPLTATSLGATAALAAVVVGLSGVGTIAGDLPATALASRLGDRAALLLAGVVAMLALWLCAVTANWIALAVAVLAQGLATSVFQLARQAFLIERTPLPRRATALSMFGGINRIGLFVGPFVGAAMIQVWGVRAPFWMALGCTVSAMVLTVALVPGGEGRVRRLDGADRNTAFMARHAKVFATLGLGVLLLGATRAVRLTALPLWSEHIGMSAGTTSVVFGVAGLMESLLFYPAGRMMDRVGRRWVAVPATLALAGGLVALPLATSLLPLVVCALIIGIGNGVGAGIVMTIGADAAPHGEVDRFIGVWRLLTDTGVAVGPFLVTLGAGLAGLASGVVLGGSAGLMAAAIFGIWLPRWSVLATPGLPRSVSGAQRQQARPSEVAEE